MRLPSGEDFAPILPQTSTLIGFTSIVLLSAVAVYVWATQVVPVERTKLAVSKRSGEVKEYLDELQADEHATDTRRFERWLFTDWLETRQAKPGRQKDPALPILKKAKWNSGDNPVLVASALIGLGVLLGSLTERLLANL